MTKVINISYRVIVYFMLFLCAFNIISWQKYLILLGIVFLAVTLLNFWGGNSIFAGLFVRQGCFSEANEHYGVITMKTAREDIDRIGPEDFPYFIRDLYIRRGYTAQVTSYAEGEEDYFGANVTTQKGKDIAAIKTVFFFGKEGQVGNDVVQRVIASQKVCNANKSVVITNRSFTESAIKQALPNGTQLINGDELAMIVRRVIADRRQCGMSKKDKGFMSYLIPCRSCFGIGNKHYGVIQKNTIKRELEHIDPLDFEYLIRDYFRANGYKAKTTNHNDLGADVIARQGEKVIAVQVKHHKDSNDAVNEEAVQQAVAAKAIYNANTSMVITNGVFTAKALELAQYNDTIMIDGEKLLPMIEKLIERKENGTSQKRTTF